MLEQQPSSEKRKFPLITVVIGLVVATAIALSLWTIFRSPESKPLPAAQINIRRKMTAQEEMIAQGIRIENMTLSRAENFIHQEVIIVNAEIVSGGPPPIQDLILTFEFSDNLNQVVLRESRNVLGTASGPLEPGQRRAFQLSFDGVPSSWNMQPPSVRVTHIQFASLK
jgi:hypothetical protein